MGEIPTSPLAAWRSQVVCRGRPLHTTCERQAASGEVGISPMLKCPQCTKPLRELSRHCPTCKADLDLLVDYVSNLQGGLERAESFVRAGELAQAVWAYLEVLEVDP